MFFLRKRYSRTLSMASKPAISLLIISAICTGCAQRRPVTTRPRPSAAIQQQDQRVQPQQPATGQYAPQSYQQKRPTEPPAPDLLMPGLTLVNERIYAYEQKIDAWQKINSERAAFTLDQAQTEKMIRCRRELSGMLNAYNRLHEQLLRKSSTGTSTTNISATLFELQKQDIIFLESDCNQQIERAAAGETPSSQPGIDMFAQAEQHIAQATTAGEHDAVIKLYDGLPPEKDERLSRKAIFQYGFALMKTGQTQKALKTFNELLTNPSTRERVQWEFKVLQLMSDLNFGLGRFDQARAGYEELKQAHQALNKEKDWAVFHAATLEESDPRSREIRDYGALILLHLSYLPERDGFKLARAASLFLMAYPSSSLAPIVEAILAEAEEPAQKWFDTQLARLSQLINEKKYSEALELIQSIPADSLKDEQQAILRTKSDEITSAQSIEIEHQRMREQQRLETNWNKAMNALEAKEYDQAIALFSTMEDTPYSGKARERVTEAANLAAQEGRREAAELFVRATRATNIEDKKNLLFSSHRLLSEILVKYPATNLTDKIKRNLQRIRDEIAAINPALLNDPALHYPEPTARATDTRGRGPAPEHDNGASRGGYITQ